MPFHQILYGDSLSQSTEFISSWFSGFDLEWRWSKLTSFHSLEVLPITTWCYAIALPVTGCLFCRVFCLRLVKATQAGPRDVLARSRANATANAWSLHRLRRKGNACRKTPDLSAPARVVDLIIISSQCAKVGMRSSFCLQPDTAGWTLTGRVVQHF